MEQVRGFDRQFSGGLAEVGANQLNWRSKPLTWRNDLKYGFWFHFSNEIALWGNKCDLSISAGEGNYSIASPMSQVTELQSFILVNHMKDVYAQLNETQSTEKRIDVILDNAGLELFTDLCLAEFLLDAGFATKIVFHVKAMPWFVSDTTWKDFSWSLEMLRSSDSKSLSNFGHKWHERIEKGEFELKVERFWTSVYSFWEMIRVEPELYAYLKESKLVIFKGDLNYRKLVSDLDWDPTTEFRTALRGFNPAPLVVLRTLKADTVTGLEAGRAEKLSGPNGNKDWMTSGEYAVIQFCT